MPRRADIRLTLRLPREVFEALKAAAEAEVRSVNGQIELAIKEHLERRRQERQAPPESPERGPNERRGTFTSGRSPGT
ncbi:MAG TPA: Arc family DNA-binding protein [Chloroflexota bacterium]|nr:Arc family DNA-binding protein [Chloroflexota bacterium]